MNQDKEIVISGAILVLIFLQISSAVAAKDTDDKIAALSKENLNLNNRLAVLEGHRPTLDENDGMIFDAIEALNYNDQIIANEINRIACEVSPSECAFIYD